MTNNQLVSVLQAVDELGHINDVRCLIEIAYEQLDHPLDEHEQTILRCQILIGQFIDLMDGHLEKIQQHLGNLKD